VSHNFVVDRIQWIARKAMKWAQPVGLGFQLVVACSMSAHLMISALRGDGQFAEFPFWFMSLAYMWLSAAIIAPIAIFLKRPWGWLVEAPVLAVVFFFMLLFELYGRHSVRRSGFIGEFGPWLLAFGWASIVFDLFKRGFREMRGERDRLRDEQRLRPEAVQARELAATIRAQAVGATPADSLYLKATALELEKEAARLDVEQT
jgi:hypothetical protein